MNRRITRSALITVLGEDRELLERLFADSLLPADASEFTDDEVITACVARTLVRDLEVNWAGVEIVLRMRAELIATHRQVAELIELLRQGSLSER